MNTILIKVIQIIFVIIFFICTAYEHKSATDFTKCSFLASRQIHQQQKPKQKNSASHTITNKAALDTTFALKIENDKRVVDDALKARLIRELKTTIAKYNLKKPYKIAMGFTKGAREVETFLFGEQIFYTLAENGFTITGIPLDMPDETPNAIPQIKVMNNTIYVILSKM